jgi:hypothetical protein
MMSLTLRTGDKQSLAPTTSLDLHQPRWGRHRLFSAGVVLVAV